MPCVVCGNPITCDAHIHAKALGRDIIKRAGRKLSLAAPNRMHNNIQSGCVDSTILCSECDGKLGPFDKHVAEVTRLLGTANEAINLQTRRFTITSPKGIDHEKLALYAASVVWRTSVSRYRELSEFTLGGNAVWFQDMIFRTTPEIPTVLVARLVGANALTRDAAVTALSYPVGIKLRDKHVARFVASGLLFLVQTTRAKDASLLSDAVTVDGRSLGTHCLTGALYPFEELADLRDVRNSQYVRGILG